MRVKEGSEWRRTPRGNGAGSILKQWMPVLWAMTWILTGLDAASHGDLSYEIVDGEVIITGSNCTTADLMIPGEIEGLPVTAINNHAFSGCQALASVDIPQSVREIGHSAFAGCSSLVLVNLPDSLNAIQSHTFADCTSLVNIRLPEGLTSVANYSFDGCSDLVVMNFPASVTSIGPYALYNNRLLNAIHVNADNPVYQSVDGILYNKSMSTLHKFPQGRGGTFAIPDSVTILGEAAFAGSANLTDITIPGRISNIGHNVFAGCSSLSEVNIPSSVTFIGSAAFYGCSDLLSLAIPSSVTSIGIQAFAYCTNLASVTIPASVTILWDGVFRGCISLERCTFEGDAPELYHANIFSEPYPSTVVFYYSDTSGWDTFFSNARTAMIQRGGLWSGTHVFQDNWRYSNWLGWFQVHAVNEDYIDHLFLGDCWVTPIDEQQYWIQTRALGWVFMHTDWSLWLWRWLDGHWYWLDQASWPPRAWDADAGEWVDLRP